jgi:branched-subunit amino acid ABC-type transport system permease component
MPPLAGVFGHWVGLGALMRGIAALAFQRVFSGAGLQRGVIVPRQADCCRLSALCNAVTYHVSRTGLALRAIADSQSLAEAMGINVQRRFTLTWQLAA